MKNDDPILRRIPGIKFVRVPEFVSSRNQHFPPYYTVWGPPERQNVCVIEGNWKDDPGPWWERARPLDPPCVLAEADSFNVRMILTGSLGTKIAVSRSFGTLSSAMATAIRWLNTPEGQRLV